MNGNVIRLLIFGGTGQVGTSLRQGNWPGVTIQTPPRQTASLTEQEALIATVRHADADIVVNAAAYTAVDHAEIEPAVAQAVNCDGAATIAMACAETGRPLIHLSTDYVFDGSNPGPYAEDARVCPLNVYGASKAAGEQAIREHFDRYLIIRTSWVFAPHGQNFVRTMLRVGQERDHLRVVDDQHGGPTPAGAIAATIVALARGIHEGGDAWGTYHYAGRPATTWHGFAEAIFAVRQRITGQTPPRIEPIATADYPTPARRPLNSVLDTRRIADVWGIAAPDWRPAMEEAVRAFSTS